MSKIARVFGAHIGCEVLGKDETCENVGILVDVKLGVKKPSIKVKYTEFNDGRWFKIKMCKLILKPLTAMSDKDKKEFEKVFREKNNQVVSNVRKNGVYIVVDMESRISDDSYEAFATADEVDFLRGKGYDTNVSNEHKILEG